MSIMSEEQKIIDLENEIIFLKDVLSEKQNEIEEKSTIIMAGAEKVKQLEKEIEERDKYNITTLPFEELKEMIEQNKNISIFGKEYITKEKIREIIGKYIDIQEHKKYTNQELYGEDLKNMINELLEENDE